MPIWWKFCRSNVSHVSTQHQLGIHTPRDIMWAKCDKDFLSSASSEVPGRVWSKNTKIAPSKMGKGEWGQLELISSFFQLQSGFFQTLTMIPQARALHMFTHQAFTLDQMPTALVDACKWLGIQMAMAASKVPILNQRSIFGQPHLGHLGIIWFCLNLFYTVLLGTSGYKWPTRHSEKRLSAASFQLLQDVPESDSDIGTSIVIGDIHETHG